MLAADTVVIAIVTHGHLVMVKIAYLESDKESHTTQQEHPPPVGLDVFLAYLLHVYMETVMGMHQSQSQKTVL